MMATSQVAPDRGGPRLSLGSWHVFSRLTLDESAELVKGAIDRGITLFDVGDYWDHEQLNTTRFRDVVQLLGLPRDSFQVAVKLFTNSAESRAQTLGRYLDLLGLDHVDYINCSRPSQTETLEEACEAMHGLIAGGLSKALALGLWGAPLLADAYRHMARNGLTMPEFVQFQYNVCRRDVIESAAFEDLFATTGVRLQAAFTLEGGILAGHVHRRRYSPEDRAAGQWFPDRNIARDSGDVRDKILASVPALRRAAESIGVTPAQLAMAFPATNPNTHSVIFGATKVWQLDEAVGALRLARERPSEVKALVEGLRIAGAGEPRLFDYSAGMH